MSGQNRLELVILTQIVFRVTFTCLNMYLSLAYQNHSRIHGAFLHHILRILRVRQSISIGNIDVI